MRGARITGWGLALPDKVITNADFEARLDTTDEWIVDRTGIKERRYGGTTSSLAIEAAQNALARAGRSGIGTIAGRFPCHHDAPGPSPPFERPPHGGP